MVTDAQGRVESSQGGARETQVSLKLNGICRELALDLAEGNYAIQIHEHIRGLGNYLADRLSRLWQPGVPQTLPKELAEVRGTKLGARGKEWWRTRLEGEENEEE